MKKPAKRTGPKLRYGIRLSPENAASVNATAEREKRTPSFVIDRIVGQHYAKGGK